MVNRIPYSVPSIYSHFGRDTRSIPISIYDTEGTGYKVDAWLEKFGAFDITAIPSYRVNTVVVEDGHIVHPALRPLSKWFLCSTKTEVPTFVKLKHVRATPYHLDSLLCGTLTSRCKNIDSATWQILSSKHTSREPRYKQDYVSRFDRRDESRYDDINHSAYFCDGTPREANVGGTLLYPRQMYKPNAVTEYFKSQGNNK